MKSATVNVELSDQTVPIVKVLVGVLTFARFAKRCLMKQPKIGDQIKVNAHHWCRAHDEGTIVAAMPHGRFEVLFDVVGAGYGDGKLLIVDIKDFEVIG